MPNEVSKTSGAAEAESSCEAENNYTETTPAADLKLAQHQPRAGSGEGAGHPGKRPREKIRAQVGCE
jgi:hypothetical protein